jgi:hypothetical protein
MMKIEIRSVIDEGDEHEAEIVVSQSSLSSVKSPFWLSKLLTSVLVRSHAFQIVHMLAHCVITAIEDHECGKESDFVKLREFHRAAKSYVKSVDDRFHQAKESKKPF